MIKYIIYGAGVTGSKAYYELGEFRVECFVETERRFDSFCGKKVLSFSELILLNLSEYIIVVASEKFFKQIELQLINKGINNYFIYHENDSIRLRKYEPGYMMNGCWERVSYNRLLAYKNIQKYNSIAFYGNNELSHYMMCEVAFQNQKGLEAIKGIISTENEGDFQTLGKPCITLEEAWDTIDCLIVCNRRSDSSIYDTLFNQAHAFEVINTHNVDEIEPLFMKSHLAKYKDIYRGERIWLIGNGPSLRIEDLEVLWEKKEITIAFNNIYKAFNRTMWRPTYIAVTDPRVMVNNLEAIIDSFSGTVFAADRYMTERTVSYTPGIEYIHLNSESYYPNMPDFSEKIEQQVYVGNSSVYDIGMQLASYMGAKEIMLLGVDHNVVGNITDKKNHFIENYYDSKDVEIIQNTLFKMEWIEASYKKAELYSRKKGFRIFNATRGGRLEVFERVNFDSLFNN